MKPQPENKHHHRAAQRRTRTLAADRNESRRLANVRLLRTVILGAIATVAALFWLGEKYGVEREVMLQYLATTGLFVGGLVLAGLAGAVILNIVKRFHSRSRKNRSVRGK